MAALALPASASNLLVNGGFEDGATGQVGSVAIPGWNTWGSSGWHHDDAGRVIDTKAIKFWWDDAGAWQDVPVVAGQQYDFSAMALSVSSNPLVGWNGLIKAEFYNSALGTDAANRISQIDVDRFYSATDPRDQWVPIGGTVTVPAGADLARVVLLIVDWQSGVSGELNFDAASITPVPEPTTAVLLAGLLVVGLRRRGR